MDIVKKTLKDVPAGTKSAYTKAMQVMNQNNLEYAITLFKEIVQFDPGFLDAREKLRKCERDLYAKQSTVAIGLVAYVVVEFGLSRFLMLYGKRKFAAFVFIALILRIIFNLAFGGIFDALDALTSVGVITAALIASTVSKQGLPYTLLGTVVVTAIVYVGAELIAMV